MISFVICLIQVTMVAGIALVVVKIVAPRSPQFAAWICFAGGLLCSLAVLLFVADTPRVLNLAQMQSTGGTQRTVAGSTKPSTLPSGLSDRVPSNPGHGLTSWLSFGRIAEQVLELEESRPHFGSQFARLGVWALMAILGIGLTRQLVGFVSLLRLWRSRRLLVQEQLQFQLSALAKKAGIARPLRIYSSRLLESPCVCWLAPCAVFVPEDFSSWSRNEKSSAMAHEVGHIRRKDARWRLFMELGLSLASFHPLAWILRREFVFFQELATDRMAARLLSNTTQYRKALSFLALRKESQVSVSVVSVSTNNLVRRIRMLKNPLKPTVSASHAFALFGAFLLVNALVLSWDLQADEGTSKQPVSAPVAQENTFQYAPYEPWIVLGPRPGYFGLRFDGLPKELQERIWAELELELTAIDPMNLSAVASDLQVDLKILTPDEQEAKGKKHEGRIFSTNYAVETKEAVDWRSVGSQVIEQWDVPEIAMQPMLDAFAANGVSNQFKMVLGSKEVASESDPALIAACQLVNRGVSFIGVPMPRAALHRVGPQLEEEDDPAGLIELADSTEFFGLGVDAIADAPQVAMQLAFVPVQGVAAEDLADLIQSRTEQARVWLAEFDDLGSFNPESLGSQVEASQIHVVDLPGLDRKAVLLQLVIEAELSEILGLPSQDAELEVATRETSEAETMR